MGKNMGRPPLSFRGSKPIIFEYKGIKAGDILRIKNIQKHSGIEFPKGTEFKVNRFWWDEDVEAYRVIGFAKDHKIIRSLLKDVE